MSTSMFYELKVVVVATKCMCFLFVVFLFVFWNLIYYVVDSRTGMCPKLDY